MPVADGDLVTVTYVDEETASADTATVTATAVVDLTPPKITKVRPATQFDNSLIHIFELEIEDAPGAPGAQTAGLDKAICGDAGILVILAPAAAVSANCLQPVLTASNPDKVRIALAQTFQNQGTVKFWVPTRDEVSNTPAFAGEEAVEGAGYPALPTVEPDNPFKLTIDTDRPELADVDPVKTGGKLDNRLETSVNGTHTGGSSVTTLNDPDANFVSDNVRVGDTVNNVTDGSEGTIVVVNSATTVTVGALSGGIDNGWDNGDAYTIENPGLGNVIDDPTNRNGVRVLFELGLGGAPLDGNTVGSGDFAIKQGPTTFTVVGAVVGADGAGILLNILEDLSTNATPTLEIPGTIQDLAGNVVAPITGPNAVTALDGLAPLLTVVVTGEAASRPVSRESVTITVIASEPVSFPAGQSTARYLREAPDGTLEEDPSKAANLSFFSVLGPPNTFEAIIEIDDITVIIARQRGLVNVQIVAQDTVGIRGTTGLADPDGTAAADAGEILPSAIVFEFDNVLNNGVFPAFSLSNTKPEAPNVTFVGDPTVTVEFTGEGDEYKVLAGLRALSFDVDAHANVDVTKATLTLPDTSTVDVTASAARLDDDTWSVSLSGLLSGNYTLTVQAADSVGNTDLTPGGLDVDDLIFDFSVDLEAGGAVQGEVFLQGQNNSLGAYISVDDEVHFANVDGTYNIFLLVGTYDVVINAPGYLPVTITGVQVNPSLAPMPTVILEYRDANDDGVADVRDLSAQAANLGKTGGTIPAP